MASSAPAMFEVNKHVLHLYYPFILLHILK